MIVYLKWGTLKGWEGMTEGTPARAALERYLDEPTSISAMMQRDTETQREALIDLITAVDAAGGEIWNDWDGKRMTLEVARSYIETYGDD